MSLRGREGGRERKGRKRARRGKREQRRRGEGEEEERESGVWNWRAGSGAVREKVRWDEERWEEQMTPHTRL